MRGQHSRDQPDRCFQRGLGAVRALFFYVSKYLTEILGRVSLGYRRGKDIAQTRSYLMFAVQQVGAGEQYLRLSVPNCDPVSLTLAVFTLFPHVLIVGL